MNKKIFGIMICILLITTAIPTVEAVENISINTMVQSKSLMSMDGNWTEIQKLLADPVAVGFGNDVSIDGDTALIGASEFSSAYIFIRNGTTWVQQAVLSGGGRFGSSVSLEGDTALIGAKDDIDEYGAHTGAAYVFTRIGNIWTQQQKLLGSGGVMDAFGCSVSLDGDTALIGAVGGNSAYVFTKTGSTWIQQTKFHLPYSSWSFGVSVALDGDTALVGACDIIASGTVFVYTRSGTNWTEQAQLSAGGFYKYFGYSIALDGDIALIGAPFSDLGENPGEAYVFTRTSTTWTQQAMLLASDSEPGKEFGFSVSLDGDTALIGAQYGDGNDEYSGSAYVFTRTGINWVEQAKLIASDGDVDDWFGYSVALNGDTAFIGTLGDDDNGNWSGSAYIYINQLPPSPPTITGSSWGLTNVNYTFCSNGADPNEDNIYCKWDWGDGNITEWLGPYSSGETICTSHVWSQKGVYEIQSKLKDVYEQESNWSEPHIFNVNELNKSFIFGKYMNLTTEGDYITIEAVNLRLILCNPFQWLHYINGEKITYVKDASKLIIFPQRMIGLVDVLT